MHVDPTPSYLLSIYAPSEEELAETRSLYAATISGRALLARQGYSAAEIDALAARHKEPGAVRRPVAATAPSAQPSQAKPLPAIVSAPPFPVKLVALAHPTAAATDGAPDAWRREFAASAELQAEFASAERYVNYQHGVKSGRVRVFSGGGASGSRVARSFVASPARQPVKG